VASELYIDTARILIVEESAVLRQLALNQVEELGLIAQTVNDIEEALKRMAQMDFDIVLVEVKAPESMAIQRIETLRKAAAKRARKLPVVAMSSGIKRGPLLGAGADDVLTRPFMGADLEALIDRWLSPGAIR